MPNVYFKSCDFSPRNICKGYHALNDTLQAPSLSNSFHEISTIADDNDVYLENSDEGLEILSKIRTKRANEVPYMTKTLSHYDYFADFRTDITKPT